MMELEVREISWGSSPGKPPPAGGLRVFLSVSEGRGGVTYRGEFAFGP